MVFALTPLLVNFLLVRDAPNFAYTMLYNRGELFLVTAALSADTAGRLIGRTGERSLFDIFCFVCALYLLAASSIEFGIAAPKFEAGLRLPQAQTADSLKMFVGMVLAGLGAVLTEEDA